MILKEVLNIKHHIHDECEEILVYFDTIKKKINKSY